MGASPEEQEPLIVIANAIVAYNEGNISEALKHLKTVVELNPNSPLEIWMAIGICYFHLNNLPKAKFALEHVIENDPENAMALTALGITELQLNCSSPQQREKAVLLFQRSFHIDDTNPLTMKHLADHFFFSNELEISQELCIRALKYCNLLKKPDNADLPNFRKNILLLSSDISFILGKIFHKGENFEEASKYYFQAIKNNKQNLSAQFCLAKIHFLNGNYTAVDECLNIILSQPKCRDSFEAIKLLAKVKSLQGKRYEALALFRRVIELNPKDYLSNFEVAQMFDQVDQPLAL
jgi:tetratricopeptide (TPR) repeat protein